MSRNSPRKRGRPAKGGATKPLPLREQVAALAIAVETLFKINDNRIQQAGLLDGPLADTLRKATILGSSGPPKTSSFPESLDVISSDLARLQNLLDAINNRLYGDSSPTSDAAATPPPYSVSDKTTTIRFQANHSMNFAESILNRF